MAEAHAAPAPQRGGHELSIRTLGYAACVALTLLVLGLEFSGAGHTLVFIVASFALVALAWLIGVATEELGASLGPRAGGILNATFGNAAELIITFFALRRGLVEVVKASITGSLLGNLLLVLGASLLFGGLRHGVQQFSRTVAGVNSTMLVIAVVALFVPDIFAKSVDDADALNHLSDGVAIVLLLIYALSLIFFFRHPQEGAGAVVVAEEHAAWGAPRAGLILLVTAGFVAFVSEILVSALEPTIEDWGISEIFAGIILIPLVGNIAEHLVGVQLAWRNKMDFSLIVSLGSSLQIALFVAPVLVFLSHFVGPEPMNLVFTDLEVATVGLSVILVALIALDGESNWLEGAQLLAVYAIIGLAFFFFP